MGSQSGSTDQRFSQSEVVFTDSLTQGVKESPGDVTAAINDHSGDL
jgi:hypothetical protein